MFYLKAVLSENINFKLLAFALIVVASPFIECFPASASIMDAVQQASENARYARGSLRGVGLDTVRNVALQVGGTQSVRLDVAPGARCTISGWPTSLVLHADQKGRVEFTVGATPVAIPLKTQVISCWASGRLQSIPMSLYRVGGSATETMITKPDHVPVSNDAIRATDRRLGIDVLTATEATLTAHDLPPRPNDAASLQSWLNAVVNPFSEIVHEGTVVPELKTHLATWATKRGHIVPASSVQPVASNNWAGYVAYTAPNTWKAVNGEWQVPPLNLTVDSSNGDTAAEWIGLDGFSNSSDLIQDGTYGIVSHSNGYAIASYILWYEYVPGYVVGAFNVRPGDTVICEAWASNPHNPTTSGSYWCEDTITKQVLSASLPNQGAAFVGDSVEWIMERLTVGGQLTGLADFNNVNGAINIGATGTYSAAGTLSGPTVKAYDVANYQVTMYGQPSTLATATICCPPGVIGNRLPIRQYAGVGYTWDARF